MEALAFLLGAMVFLGGPLTLIVVAVLGLRRANRAEARAIALEAEVDMLRLRVDGLEGLGPQLRPAPAPASLAAPAEAAPSVPAAAALATASVPDAAPTAPGPGPAAGRSPTDPAAPSGGHAAEPPPPQPRRPELEDGHADDLFGDIPTAPPRPRLSPERLATWLAAGLGGLSLLVAAGFAVAVAVDRGWMGPGIRAGAGLLLATGLWVASEPLRRRRLPRVAAALAGAGVGGLYSVLWATHGLWHLIPALAAFGLMAAVAAVATLQAHRRDDRFAAALGVVGALLTPVLASTGQNRPFALFGYLCLVGLGAAVPAARKGWTGVLALVGVGSAALHVGWTARYLEPGSRLGAIVGVGLLLVPAVIAVLRARPQHLPTAAVTRLQVLLLPLLAIPWLVPLDAHFYDLTSGMSRWNLHPQVMVLVLAAVALLPTPAVVLARRGPDPSHGLAPVGIVLALVAAAVAGFSGAPTADTPLLAASLAVPALAALALGTGRPQGGPGAAVALLAIGVLGAGLVESTDAVSALWVTTGAALAAGLGVGASWSPVLLPALAAAALPLAMGAEADIAPSALGGLGVLSLAGLGVVPLTHHRWRRGAGAIAAALAGPALFLPLWTAWQAGPLSDVPGLLPVGLGAISLVGAAVLARRERVKADSGRLASLVGAAMLGAVAAVPLQLENGWLTVAWALEAAAVAAVAMRLSHPLLRWAPVLLGVAVTVRLTVNPAALDYGDSAGIPILNWTLWTWGIPALALGVAAALQQRARALDSRAGLRATLLMVMAIAVGFALVNVQVAHAFRDAGPLELHETGLMEGMVRSIAWAVYGLLVLVGGIRLQRGALRLLGFLLMLLAAGKVFAVDLWSLEGFVRVGSVLGLGVTLLVSAWLFERVVRRGSAPGVAEET